MTKAEERAMEAYPPLMQYTSLMSANLKNKTDANLPKREIYIEGYEQAEQDLIEKAKQWFTQYLPSEKVQLLWSEFEQSITEN